MSTPTILEINAETGEEILRDFNAEELAQQAIDVAEQEAKTAEAEQAKIDKEALLTKLGITADEAKLLLS
jgi:hypothetical protein